VVPVDHIAEMICDREPEDVKRERVRTVLTETVLPALDRESVLGYDTEQNTIINYGEYEKQY
jgi:hypothetical protein